MLIIPVFITFFVFLKGIYDLIDFKLILVWAHNMFLICDSIFFYKKKLKTQSSSKRKNCLKWIKID